MIVTSVINVKYVYSLLGYYTVIPHSNALLNVHKTTYRRGFLFSPLLGAVWCWLSW
jgi:cobalamin synthase